ncbi:hypothetical protein IWX78_003071 [Mycetocola sp. CAN_C7]|uniref:hypothetical protein n=1 Tax=Mycetocola sp. CAN_C7 TaxID=2787724 RepID=UPI0018C93B16
MTTQDDRVRILGDAPVASEPENGPAWLRALDKALSVQRPVVVAHIRALRRSHPNATPAQLVRILERRYLTAITTGGAAVGATAMVPGFGTGITLTLAGAETVGFLETTALFAQSVTEVHGIALDDPVRARALVMTLMLGKSGTDLVRQFTGQALSGGPGRKVFWGEMVAKRVPQAMMGPVADELKRRFMKHFVLSQGSSLIGKAMPFGIGAAIGGIGNNVAGRQVVTAARTAFGPAPVYLPLELEPRDRRARPTMRELRERLPLPRRRRSRDADEIQP